MKPQPTVTDQRLSIWKTVCVEFMKAYQEQKVDRMISLCDSNSTIWFKPPGEDGKGKVHELGKGLWTSLIDSFPDIDNTVHSLTANTGKICCDVSIRGGQEKDFAGIQSKGASFNSSHVFVFTLDNNQQIQHIVVDWDHADFVRQLGGASV